MEMKKRKNKDHETIDTKDQIKSNQMIVVGLI